MTTGYVLTVVTVWVGVGLATAFVMRRRGHDFYVWLALGTVLGPLIVPLALERARYHGAVEQVSASMLSPSPSGLDVLAGVDGSEESVAAIRSALDLFGGSITSLTIATVLDYDSESSAAGDEPKDNARAMLDDVISALGVEDAQTEILFGRADRALAGYARTHGVELIVVGTRGRGATEALFGSITGRLVGGCEIPVYVGPTPAGRAEEITSVNLNPTHSPT